jgi:hypothetical protein
MSVGMVLAASTTSTEVWAGRTYGYSVRLYAEYDLFG